MDVPILQPVGGHIKVERLVLVGSGHSCKD